MSTLGGSTSLQNAFGVLLAKGLTLETDNIHATTLAVDTAGVLIRGRPGAGKSRLALAMLDWAAGDPSRRFCRLVADDRTALTRHGDRLVATAPPEIAARLEVRGHGIVSVAPWPAVRITHIVELPEEGPERLPDETMAEASLLGLLFPRLQIRAGDSDAAVILRHALGSNIKD